MNYNQIKQKIRNAGVQDTHDIRQQNRLISMNTLYACVAVMIMIFTSITVFQDGWLRISACLGFLGLSVLLIYLNYLRRYRAAIWLHFFLSGSPGLLFSYISGFEGGFYLYALVAPISVLLFVDSKNKVDLIGAVFYYSLLYVVALGLHLYGKELRIVGVPYTYLLTINFVFTAIFIAVLGLTFVRLNEAYVEEIEHKSDILLAQRDEITAANDTLMEKNEEISDLVGILNDKVKNNLQIIALFTELDTLNMPTEHLSHLLLLQKSRVKVLDICYAMIFEEKTTNSAWFEVCISRYYDFFKVNYAIKILETSNFDLIMPANTPSVDRKKFELIMLLFNEWHFSIFDALVIPTEIDLVCMLILTDNAEHPFHLQVKIAGHSAKKLIVNKKIRKFRQQKIQIQTTYDTDKDTHSFIASF